LVVVDCVLRLFVAFACDGVDLLLTQPFPAALLTPREALVVGVMM